MGVVALVMAGGRGTRMKLRGEKPLLEVGGKPLIEHVLNALKNASMVDKIVVVVSRHTPKTARTIKGFSVKVLETPGKDYVSDTRCAIKNLKLDTVLTISADLPLIKSEVIDEVIAFYELRGKPALTVAVPLETCEKLGLEVDHIFEVNSRRLVPAGINVIDGRQVNEKELKEEILVVDREEVAVNVNTPKNLKIAECLFRQCHLANSLRNR